MAAQLPDKIIVEGRERDLYSNPLEQFWIIRKKKRPRFYSSEECARGYIATWKLEEGQLFLTKIEGEMKGSILLGARKVKCSLRKLFWRPNKNGVRAAWFTGKLRIPTGNMTRFDDHEYDSRFEKELIISLENGNVVKSVTLDYSHQTLILNEL